MYTYLIHNYNILIQYSRRFGNHITTKNSKHKTKQNTDKVAGMFGEIFQFQCVW